MITRRAGPPPKGVWAYGYELTPPQSEDSLLAIKRLLADEHSEAKRGARTWRAKVVTEEKVTHILVVSDTAEQDRDINKRLEAELTALQVAFSRTASLALDEDAPSWHSTA